jgi:hypothetical protein
MKSIETLEEDEASMKWPKLAWRRSEI